MAILSDAVARAPGLKFLLVALDFGCDVGAAVLRLYRVDGPAGVRADRVGRHRARLGRSADHRRAGAGDALRRDAKVSAIAEGAVTTVDVRRVAVFLPKTLNANAITQTQTRSRGIFDVNVYTADIGLNGTFGAPNFTELGFTPKSIAWDQAVLLLPISTFRV